MFDALIPAGPLHPDLAVIGLMLGGFVALAAHRRPRAWIALVFSVLAVAMEARLGQPFLHGFRDRSDIWLMAIALLLPVVAFRRAASVSGTAVAALGATAAVWAIVPDTEVAVLVGTILVGGLLRSPKPDPTRWASVVLVLPVVAAIAGSVGRTERLAPALGAGLLGVIVVAGVLGLVQHLVRSQRAGTPTTVEPAATFSMTTAPAPTTAP